MVMKRSHIVRGETHLNRASSPRRSRCSTGSALRAPALSLEPCKGPGAHIGSFIETRAVPEPRRRLIDHLHLRGPRIQEDDDNWPEQEWPEDRRHDPRIVVATQAVVLARHNDGVALTIDSLSVGGARLVGHLTLDRGERVQILFEVAGQPVEVHGEVIRVEKQDMMTDRIAVKFVEVESRARRLITRLVRDAIAEEENKREAESNALLDPERTDDAE